MLKLCTCLWLQLRKWSGEYIRKIERKNIDYCIIRMHIFEVHNFSSSKYYAVFLALWSLHIVIIVFQTTFSIVIISAVHFPHFPRCCDNVIVYILLNVRSINKQIIKVNMFLRLNVCVDVCAFALVYEQCLRQWSCFAWSGDCFCSALNDIDIDDYFAHKKRILSD